MNYRNIGKYGVKVSEVALGGWLTQGRTLTDDTTERIVKTAFDLGINFFDSADVYNRGEAEIAMSHALRDIRREDLFVATKCFFPMSEAPNDHGLSRKHITESVHASLIRLKTPYVDLFQFHRFDPETPIEESVRAIDDLARQGKVLYWGVSEWTAPQIEDAVRIAKELNALPPISNQPQYNMLQRGIEEAVLPTTAKLGMGNVCFSPLAQGVLTGKYLPNQPAPEGTRGADENSNMFMGPSLTDESLTKIQKLKAYVESHGFTLAQFALAWCLRQPAMSSVIIGATKPEHVTTNATASGLQVDPAHWAEAEKILGGSTWGA